MRYGLPDNRHQCDLGMSHVQLCTPLRPPSRPHTLSHLPCTVMHANGHAHPQVSADWFPNRDVDESLYRLLSFPPDGVGRSGADIRLLVLPSTPGDYPSCGTGA